MLIFPPDLIHSLARYLYSAHATVYLCVMLLSMTAFSILPEGVLALEGVKYI